MRVAGAHLPLNEKNPPEHVAIARAGQHQGREGLWQFFEQLDLIIPELILPFDFSVR